MTQQGARPHDLATGLAARLLHDLSGPATGVMAGMDLLADPSSPDLREAALELTAVSSRSLVEALEFCRVAFGAAGEAQDGATLERLAMTRFAGRRAQLVWAAGAPSLDGQAAQAALILILIAAGALASGGSARFIARGSATGLVLAVEAESVKAQLDTEVIDGLTGRPLAGGIAGRWAPAAYLRSLVDSMGGRLSLTRHAGGFVVEAVIPEGGAPSA